MKNKEPPVGFSKNNAKSMDNAKAPKQLKPRY